MFRILALAGAASLALAGAAAAQQWRLPPGGEALSGEPLALAVTDLKPGQAVTVRAERALTSGKLAAATATFRADGKGVVELSKTAPTAGDYQGADPAGLFWSVKPTETAAPADWPRGAIRLTATAEGGAPVVATLRLRAGAEDVVTEPVTDPALPGAFTAKRPVAAGKRLPVVIVLGGSEGGDGAARMFAPRFASRGFLVLGLPYYAPAYGPPGAQPIAGLPNTFVDLPLEHLEKARAYLATRPDADMERIGVYGVSKGAEFALSAAARMPWIKAVAAIVPTDVNWEGWGDQASPGGTRSSFSWQGKPLPFVPYKGFEAQIANVMEGKPMILVGPHVDGRAANPDRVAPARIPVERIKAPVLLAAGGDDKVWPSAPMAQAAADARAKAKLPTELLIYPEAGHAIGGDGYGVAVAGPGIGGTPAANARAQQDAFAKTVAFLKRALGA